MFSDDMEEKETEGERENGKGHIHGKRTGNGTERRECGKGKKGQGEGKREAWAAIVSQ